VKRIATIVIMLFLVPTIASAETCTASFVAPEDGTYYIQMGDGADYYELEAQESVDFWSMSYAVSWAVWNEAGDIVSQGDCIAPDLVPVTLPDPVTASDPVAEPTEEATLSDVVVTQAYTPANVRIS
jgi:hypothetical protein